MPLRVFRPLAVLCAAALLAVSACDGGPTAPTSYVQVAGGQAWVAVAEPRGLPRAETWLPYLSPAHRAGVDALRVRAQRARAAGQPEEALRLEAQALREAAAGVARAPDAGRMLGALAALEAWTDRARARLELGAHPELAAAAASVAARAQAARAALDAGHTAAAVRHLSEGTLGAREQSPMAVGLRLLASAEARLQARAASGAAERNARALLLGARAGLASGDSIRALRRAVYALQLLEGAPAPAVVDPASPFR
jgi:hypothetical protein